MHKLPTYLGVWLLVQLVFNTQAPGQHVTHHKVRVFILAGQSNMQGHGLVELSDPQNHNGGKGNLQNVMKLDHNKQRMSHLKNADGDWATRDDVWVIYKTREKLKAGKLSVGFSGHQGETHFGPELQIGHRLGDYFDDPVVLIKTCWGGKSLNNDFRPPSLEGETGEYYTSMMEEVAEGLDRVNDLLPPLRGADRYAPEISGLVWQQGWNDMCDDEARSIYAGNLIAFAKDVRKAFQLPYLPMVVGELGNNGETKNKRMLEFRAAQRQGAEAIPDCRFVLTSQHARPADDSPFTTHAHHWFGNAESYFLVGDSLGEAMVQLIDRKRVLILGDSISIGYGPTVSRSLADQAWVFRPTAGPASKKPKNCAGTKLGVKKIDEWVQVHGGADRGWDVIHFNFGLHDLKRVNPETGKNSNDPNHPYQSDPEKYREQLEQIVAELKKQNAQLVFATTTPVPDGVKPYRATNDPQTYNKIAVEIMERENIPVNDLYGFAKTRLAEIQLPNNVHFSKKGSEVLGKEVARVVAGYLSSN